MSEMLPNEAEKEAISKMLRGIAQLILKGSFPGSEALEILKAVNWLENGANFHSPPVPVPDLKVVPDEQK